MRPTQSAARRTLRVPAPRRSDAPCCFRHPLPSRDQSPAGGSTSDRHFRLPCTTCLRRSRATTGSLREDLVATSAPMVVAGSAFKRTATDVATSPLVAEGTMVMGPNLRSASARRPRQSRGVPVAATRRDPPVVWAKAKAKPRGATFLTPAPSPSGSFESRTTRSVSALQSVHAADPARPLASLRSLRGVSVLPVLAPDSHSPTARVQQPELFTVPLGIVVSQNLAP